MGRFALIFALVSALMTSMGCLSGIAESSMANDKVSLIDFIDHGNPAESDERAQLTQSCPYQSQSQNCDDDPGCSDHCHHHSHCHCMGISQRVYFSASSSGQRLSFGQNHFLPSAPVGGVFRPPIV